MDTKINVNMNGKEFIEYEQSKKIRLKPSQKEAVFFFVISILGILLFIYLISLFYSEPYVPNSTIIWYHGFPVSLDMINIIILLIAVSWVIHGFGFIIIKR